MKSILKGVGTIIGIGGGAVAINYHFATPLKNLEKERERDSRLGGRTPSPLPFPSDLETRWPVHLVNSLGDTYARITGKSLFPLMNKWTVDVLHQLKGLLNEQEYSRFEKTIEKCAKLNEIESGGPPMEMFLNKMMIQEQINARLHLEKSFLREDHQQILKEEKLKPHIMITGQPRTGSTFLHHLLAVDPNCRYLTEWEQSQPLPFPTKETYATDERAEQFKKRQKAMDFFVANLVKNIRGYHDHDGSGIEEEFFLLGQAMLLPMPLSLHNVPRDYFTWWTSQPRFDEYNYLKKFLVLSQHYNPPNSHFVLKAPIHSAYFEELMTVFDQGAIVVIHRDPLQTIPSLSKLAMYIIACSSRDVKTDVWVCKEEHGENMMGLVKPMIDKMAAVRRAKPEFNNRILDIEYEDLVKDPMKVVKSIYDHAGLTLSPEAEQGMLAHLKRDREDREREKKGSKFSPYTLSMFGLDEEKVKTTFAEYRKERGYPN
eukprot:CAMPEP_0201477892 /NCGR_PEP_ID=MMETSP0151_2-20130828/2840_1 /ASSEMBLY_ACC=CAM_ASM_000257 /TAXON_ID=200890 /ORGANISM="Paramoeba atlantica, Strain 621/1 / CCAP 1560/9" /LENGTH=485 /DNA_ID=CAMNT_0047858765 /DNA_START=88 /DNA_END=1545 /DNA_ORIENTATION=-